MISIVVPAHNEEAVIAAGLRSMTDGARPDEIEVIVVCNGCRDHTAAVARAASPLVRVIETDVASKPHALNLGDQAASGFPRFYVDADVVMSLESVRRIGAILERGEALAAAPAVETIFLEGTQPAVRAYYEAWMSLPYVQEGMMAAGAYAVSRDGRARFDRFPDVIADDGYFRLLFTGEERVEVRDAVCRVLAPTNLSDLIKIKTRSRLGVIQLQTLFGDLYRRDASTRRYGAALRRLFAAPRGYGGAAVYLWVTAVSRYRAIRQASNLKAYAWERDNSSRAHAGEAKGS
jgi:glycosyltransferase involved in cell wall biosynthesis